MSAGSIRIRTGIAGGLFGFRCVVLLETDGREPEWRFGPWHQREEAAEADARAHSADMRGFLAERGIEAIDGPFAASRTEAPK